MNSFAKNDCVILKLKHLLTDLFSMLPFMSQDVLNEILPEIESKRWLDML